MATRDYFAATYPNHSKGYQAHTTNGERVTLPDAVYEDQKEWDGKQIQVLDLRGTLVSAILRGDLYGLWTSGTGDPIVELAEDAPPAGRPTTD